jgi:hypothetical protein
MLCNIRDSRARPFRWRRVRAILEATSHDNSCADSDPIPPSAHDLTCEVRNGLSIPEAVAWAEAQPGAVTLFLYDEGSGDEEEDGPSAAG